MTKLDYTDDEIIELISRGGRSFEDVSMFLFDQFRGFIPKVNQRLHLSDDDYLLTQ